MMLQASLLRSSIPAALRRSSSTHVGATTGGSDGAASASLSGYINLDEEETIIEEVRALDQFKPIVLSSAQVIRSKHLVFQRELFRYQHLTSRPVLTRLKAAEDKQEIERRKELKANRRRLILSGKTPVKIEPLLPPATQLSGG
ncbi:MAG: hypothetical protein Q8P67_00870, partial [archaeon]|nr:hypothetical protein [archaeon]